MSWVPILNLKGPTGYTGYTGIKGPSGSGVDVGDGYIGPTGYTGPTGSTGDRDFLTLYSETNFDGINNIPQNARLGDYLIDFTTGIMWFDGAYKLKYTIDYVDSNSPGYIQKNPHEVDQTITSIIANTKVSQVSYTFTLDQAIYSRKLGFIPIQDNESTNPGLYDELVIDGNIVDTTISNTYVNGTNYEIVTKNNITLSAGTHSVKFTFNYPTSIYPQLSLAFASPYTAIYNVTTPLSGDINSPNYLNDSYFYELDTVPVSKSFPTGRSVIYNFTIIDAPLINIYFAFIPSQLSYNPLIGVYEPYMILNEDKIALNSNIKPNTPYIGARMLYTQNQPRTLPPGNYTVQFDFTSQLEFIDKFILCITNSSIM